MLEAKKLAAKTPFRLNWKHLHLLKLKEGRLNVLVHIQKQKFFLLSSTNLIFETMPL
jgi:hypothetical protein